MLDLLNIHLKNYYELTLVKDGATALKTLKQKDFDLIVLDVMLPYFDGWSICEEVRKASKVPILMLTARTEIEDRVKGLELGADDYLIKPFDFEELKARIKALIRRLEYTENVSDENKELMFNNGLLFIDKANRQVRFSGEPIDLTAKEFYLLRYLAESPTRVFTREELLELIWDTYEDRDLRAVDSHVKNIRTKFKKVKEGTKIIQTVWGLGYQIIIPENTL